jgi:hypothetical protein
MATDVYARVIRRHGADQFEVPVTVLALIGVNDVSEMDVEIPAGGEFIYFRSAAPTAHDAEKKEQQK